MNDMVSLNKNVGGAEAVPQQRLPVLMVAVGRGRVGKTTFLNIVGQRFRERGAKLEIWNIDPHGDGGNIETFFRDVRRPPYSGIDDRQKWLEGAISEQSEGRFDALLDVGGGDLVLQKMMKDLELGAVAESMGVRAVVVQIVGPITADLDHFNQASVGGGPNIEMLYVMNAGLIIGDISPVRAFESVFESRVIKSAVESGALAVILPHLVCLDAIVERKLTFRQASERKRHGAVEPLSIFDAARVKKWWTVGLDMTFDRIPPTWLPAVAEVSSPLKIR